MRCQLRFSSGRRAAGFTLIELMIGVLIGLLASLAVTQVMVNAEGQKRSTTSGSDAQVNGALALRTLQRELAPAGYGFAALPASLGCTMTATFNAAPIPGFSTVLAPVVITPSATAGAPDTIRMLASGKTSYSLPLRIVSPGYNPAAAPTSTQFPVATVRSVEGPSATTPGDLMIAVIDASSPCEVFRVTADPDTTPAVARADDGKWNATGYPTQTYGDGNFLVNMGSFVDRTFSVNTATGSLRQTTFKIAADATPSFEVPVDLFPGIVNLRALYGKDTNGDQVVDTWDNVTPITNAQWNQVLALRVAVVARSDQYEKENVTFNNPSWDVGTEVAVSMGAVACGTSMCLPLKVDSLPDWQHYRYKVFDTIIPLRNMLWNS
jgi:type IV pilus assembly protein PilW